MSTNTSAAVLDLDQALPAALVAIRADIAAGIIPANGSIESWEAVGIHTDHITYLVDAIFPGDTGTARMRPDFFNRCEALAHALDAAIASGELNVGLDAEQLQAIQDCDATGHHNCGQREVSCWYPPVSRPPASQLPLTSTTPTEEGPRMSNAPRDLDQALPIALAEFRTYIADGVIPADGTVQGWGDLAAYTDHNLIAIEAIFPDDKDDTAWTRSDFDPRIDELAIAIEAAIASGDLDVGLTAQARAGITECIANQHRACDGVNPCWTAPVPTTPQTITSAA